MEDIDNAPTDFADTLRMPLHELPSALGRLAYLQARQVAQAPVAVAVVPAAPVVAPPIAVVVIPAAPVAALPVAAAVVPAAPVAAPPIAVAAVLVAPVAAPPVAAAVVLAAPVADRAAAAHPVAAPKRRAGDADTGKPARFSLHRRRSTDPKRVVVGRSAPVAPVAPVAPAPSIHVSIDPPAAPGSALCLFVRGFNDTERKLLEGTIRLSQRRLPRLSLVPEADVALADVVMIDGRDAEAVAWAAARPWLARKNMIWVDSQLPRPDHMEVRRPVQWPLLPMLLARALEHGLTPQPQPAPAVTATAPTDAAGTRPAAPASSNRVLVVDDSLAVRSHLRSLLEARGMQVTDANCVGDALVALAAVPAGHFVCALMDVLMPDMDGYEGCRRIKASKASLGTLPVVMLTSKSSPFDRIRGKMAGCDAYLTKPVAPALLYAALSAYQTPSAPPAQSAATPMAANRFTSTGRG